MKRHERHSKPNEVCMAVSKAVSAIEDLTYGEIMAGLAEYQRIIAAYLIEIDRYPERFPDLRDYFAEGLAAIDNREPDEDDEA